jgi:general secretion pathway protein G
LIASGCGGMSLESTRGMTSRRPLPHALREAGKALLAVGAVALLLLFVFSLGISVNWAEPKRDRAKLDLRSIWSELQLYRRQTGRLPSTSEGLQPLVGRRALEQLPLDPWGNHYDYALDAKGLMLRSRGPDGEVGGTEDNEDIVLRIPRSEL